MAWVSEETLEMATLSPQETPEALGEFNFSWSNSIISDSTVDPSIRRRLAPLLSRWLRKTLMSPAESPSLVRVGKNHNCKILLLE